MAHGKTKELTQVLKAAPRRKCGTCGGDYESHIKVDGDMKKKYEGHVPAGLPPMGYNRETRRKMGMTGKRK